MGYVESEDPQDIVRRYETRECIESCAAGLAAKYMNGIQIEHLRSLAQELTDSVIQGDRQAKLMAAQKFHEYLMANCGNPVLYRIWRTERLAPLSHAVADHENGFRTFLPEEDRQEDHITRVVEAIAAHDQDAAEGVLRNHQRVVTTALRKSLWLNGEPPSAVGVVK